MDQFAVLFNDDDPSDPPRLYSWIEVELVEYPDGDFGWKPVDGDTTPKAG